MCRALAQNTAEDRVTEKRGFVGPVRPRATGRSQPMRVHEATIEKKDSGKQQPYEKPRLEHAHGETHPQAHFSCRAQGADRYSQHRGKAEGAPKDRQKFGAQQERLVRVSPSTWPPHTQLLGTGAPAGRASEKWLLEGLPPKVAGGSGISSHRNKSGAQGAHSW